MKSLGGYALSILLIPVYVNLFSLWKTLNSLLPEQAMVLLPIGVTLLLAAISFIFYRRQQIFNKKSLDLLPFWAGTGICIVALMVPDPNYPVKRIHVAEYMMLALVVRFAMSYKLGGMQLLLFSACFASLLGIHDEFLQGMHPSRTYGLRDMVVNTLGSCGGALIWHSLALFTSRRDTWTEKKKSKSTLTILYLVCLLLSVLALITPMMLFKGDPFIPLWPYMILFGSVVFYCAFIDQFKPEWRYGITAVSAAAFCLLLYSAVPRVSTYTFF